MKYDVVIIGAGPSGLTAALNLLKKDIKNICIVTKGDVNTHKPCAGLLTEKAFWELKKINIDVKKELSYQAWKDIDVYYKKKLKMKMKMAKAFSYFPRKCTREQLDKFLYEKVLAEKVKIFENQKIIDIDLEKQKLKTENLSFRYQYLIFADGVNGYSKRLQKQPKRKNVAYEVIFKERSNKPFVNLYFGITKKGYAWVGSSGEYINIGFTDQYNAKVNYLQLLKAFAKEQGYEIDKKDIKGAFYPSGIFNLKLSDNVFFVGDAAGLADPFTAEGLYYSFLSSRYAAEAISKKNINIFEKKLMAIVKHLREANKMISLFYTNLFQRFFWRKEAIKRDSFRNYAFDKIILHNEYRYLQIFACYKSWKRRKQKSFDIDELRC